MKSWGFILDALLHELCKLADINHGQCLLIDKLHYLLKQGANVHSRTTDSANTCLHILLSCTKLASRDFKSPLMLAEQYIVILLQSGADPFAKNGVDESVTEFAVKNDNEWIWRRSLFAAGYDPDVVMNANSANINDAKLGGSVKGFIKSPYVRNLLKPMSTLM